MTGSCCRSNLISTRIYSSSNHTSKQLQRKQYSHFRTPLTPLAVPHCNKNVRTWNSSMCFCSPPLPPFMSTACTLYRVPSVAKASSNKQPIYCFNLSGLQLLNLAISCLFLLYVAGTADSVPITEVSLIERFHCIANCCSAI